MHQLCTAWQDLHQCCTSVLAKSSLNPYTSREQITDMYIQQGGRTTTSNEAHNNDHSADSGYGDYSDDNATGISFTRPDIESPSSLTSLSLPPVNFANIANRRAQCVNFHFLLWDVFHSIWDSRAALWLSSSCNPFLETSVVCRVPRMFQVVT